MSTMPMLPSSGGFDDAYFITQARELAGDLPKYAAEQFNGDGATTTFLCSRVPMNDDDYFAVTVGGAGITVVNDQSLATAGKVWADYNTGRLVFGTAPAIGTGNVVVSKNQVDRRDATFKRALVMGLHAMYPKVWGNNVDTSITMQTNVWDYPLPIAFLSDARIFITNCEVQAIPQGGPVPFRRQRAWEQIGNSTIKILDSQAFPPGSTLRIQYAGPYSDLTQVPAREANLPILYALGMLLGTKEIQRARSSAVSATADGSASPPGTAQNAGTWFIRQFEAELVRCSRPIPMAPVKSTYNR